jgi:hypothetical protein
MSETKPWIEEMVSLLFMARMCGCSTAEASFAAWNECYPDSEKNKAERRAKADAKRRRRAELAAARPPVEPFGEVRYDGRLIEREWWPLRQRVLERDNFTCVYCGEGEDFALLCADHVVPLSRGGTNDEDNLVCACKPCNSSKNNRLLSEWEGRYQ